MKFKLQKRKMLLIIAKALMNSLIVKIKRVLLMRPLPSQRIWEKKESRNNKIKNQKK